jgi:hypothetical protein
MLALPFALAISSLLSLHNSSQSAMVLPFVPQNQVLADHTISLDDRYPVKSVSEVFKFNMILNTDLLGGEKFAEPRKLQMSDIDKPTQVSFTLKPGQTFAFHDQVLPQYQGKVALTTNANFGPSQGFKSDGNLYGDGVCHLASLLNWAASDAGLEVLAPTNHDFALIADIPKEYGTAIYYSGGQEVNAKENLYITNNKNKDIKITLNYQPDNLEARVEELN